MAKQFATKTIYAHFPPFEVRPKVKPKLIRQSGLWWCGLFLNAPTLAYPGETPAEAYRKWAAAQ